VLGWPKAPRRVVGLDQNIFIIGYRYRCVHEDRKKTYQSWSPALLNVLPPALASQFRHHLTHRGGLTDEVAALLRKCIQDGIGSSSFADMIRTFHYQQYDALHLDYLLMVRSRMQSPLIKMFGRVPPFGLFGDRHGYAGYVPSPLYFRTFYEQFMDKHAVGIDQHMAMLSARILSIDHSHKVNFTLSKLSLFIC
jgi:hypothetical protein